MSGTAVRAFGVALMLAALSLPLLRADDRPVDGLIATYAAPPSQLLELDGQLVHVRDEGPRADATPIVLLHGTSSSLHTWDGWAQRLKRERRVVRLDLPGFGITGPWTGRRAGQPYDGDALAAFVLDVLDALGVSRAVVVGNSLGGEVAWRLAARAPQRVAQLVLVAPSGLRDGAGEMPLAWRLATVPGGAFAMRHLLPRALVRQGLASVVGDASKVTDAMVERYHAMTLRAGNRQALAERLAWLAQHPGVDRIDGVRAPTLLLWGRRDRTLPLERGAPAFQRDLVGARLVVFDTLGHIPMEEDPAATLAPVRDFLGLRPGDG